MMASQRTPAQTTGIRPPMPLTGLGFDSSCGFSNKPLPLSPADQSWRPSIQSETQRSFFGFDQIPVVLDPNASFASPGLAKTTEKDELRSLVSATMSGPQELSPKERALRYRFSTSSAGSGPPSPSFAKPSRHRVYRQPNDNEPESPSIVPPAPLAYHKQDISSVVWPFRAQSPTAQNEVLFHQNGGLSPTPNGAPADRETQDDVSEQRGRRPATPTNLSCSCVRLHNSPPKTSRTRSRSPVKKLFSMVKSMSMSQMPNDHASPKMAAPGSSHKSRWKELNHKLRHGFLTADLQQLDQEEMMDQYDADRAEGVRINTPPSSRDRPMFPVSIRSSGQSKLWSELEYMLIETCNTFLKEELASNRLSRDSIIKIKRQWQARNRSQVIEFYYDQATQYELIIANLRTIQLYSDYSQDAVLLNSVLHQWKILTRELNVKTLCMPDSVIRRWLHDGRRVLELLGASQVTLTSIDKLTSLCLAVIGSAEKERTKGRRRAGTTDTCANHRCNVSDGSQHTLFAHEQTLLHVDKIPPSLSTPSSVNTASRSAIPQAESLAQQATSANGCSGQAFKPFMFTHGNRYHPGHSKSLSHAEDRGRFLFD